MILKRSKRKGFTLLELMVCLAIIGLLGAILGIKGVDLLAHHRFYSSLQTWFFDVQRMQILAMNQGSDVVCTIKKNQEGVYQACLESDSPSFQKSVHDLKEVSQFSFQSKPLVDLQVTFFSSGRIAPTGLLKIDPKRESEPPVYLDLSYPIAFQTNPKKKSNSQIPPAQPEKRKELF